MLAPWVIEEVKQAKIKDKRLNQRLAKIVDQWAKKPTMSIPAACGGNAEMTAAYRFCNNKNVSFEQVLQPHYAATEQRIAQHEVVVLAQDTTEADLTRPNQQVADAGLLDGNARWGFFLHPLMAFTPDGVPLGTLSAKVWTRDEEPASEEASQTEAAADEQPSEESAQSDQKKHRKQIPIEEKESYRWLESHRVACKVAERVEGTQLVCTADSEADIYELIQEAQEHSKADWIIRSGQNRALGKANKEEQPAAKLLRERVLNTEVLFTNTINVRGREAKVSCETRGRRQPRESRTAQVEVRAARVTLRPPWRCDRKLKPVTVNVVLVTEINPPEGDIPVEWLLLTSLPIDELDAVRKVVAYYSVRWMIEVFFRTLKTGCRVEKRRFEKLAGMQVCLAIYMIVTWRTLFVCRLGREFPDISCEAVFEPAEWQSVYQVVKKKKPPKTPPKLQEMVRLVAQLGGYVNRSRQDEPGPQTVWLGLQRLYDIANCWLLFGPGSKAARDSEEEDNPEADGDV